MICTFIAGFLSGAVALFLFGSWLAGRDVDDGRKDKRS